MAFLMQNLIYTINKWFNFVPDSFFDQDHLLKIIILGVYAKISKCAWISEWKPDRWFFLTLNVGRPFHRKYVKWKECGVTGLFSEKKSAALHAELNKKAEAATSIYSTEVDFYNIFIWRLWLRIIWIFYQAV